MISNMHANNEVGTVQPIAEIAALARQHGIVMHTMMHTDAAQAVGKIPILVDDLDVDLLSLPGGCHEQFLLRQSRVSRIIDPLNNIQQHNFSLQVS